MMCKLVWALENARPCIAGRSVRVRVGTRELGFCLEYLTRLFNWGVLRLANVDCIVLPVIVAVISASLDASANCICWALILVDRVPVRTL
jgi:hypothetical protein